MLISTAPGLISTIKQEEKNCFITSKAKLRKKCGVWMNGRTSRLGPLCGPLRLGLLPRSHSPSPPTPRPGRPWPRGRWRCLAWVYVLLCALCQFVTDRVTVDRVTPDTVICVWFGFFGGWSIQHSGAVPGYPGLWRVTVLAVTRQGTRLTRGAVAGRSWFMRAEPEDRMTQWSTNVDTRAQNI